MSSRSHPSRFPTRFETISSTFFSSAFMLLCCTHSCTRSIHTATIRPLDTAFSGNVKSCAIRPRGLAMKNPPSADLLRGRESVSNADGIDELVTLDLHSSHRLLPSLRIVERKNIEAFVVPNYTLI